MKKYVFLFVFAFLFSGTALAYDESLAKTYEQFFASFEEKQVAKALHLLPPEKVVEAIPLTARISERPTIQIPELITTSMLPWTMPSSMIGTAIVALVLPAGIVTVPDTSSPAMMFRLPRIAMASGIMAQGRTCTAATPTPASPASPRPRGDRDKRYPLRTDLDLPKGLIQELPPEPGENAELVEDIKRESGDKELVKQINKMSEDHKVALRNIRRDANSELKEMVKEKMISEDEERRGQDLVQKLTDDHIAAIDALLEEKEKDLMAI